MSTVTLIFDKLQGHPIDPDQIQLGTEGIFSTKVSNGDFLTDLSIGPKTINLTLEGVPEALVQSINGLVSNYVTAVTSGNKPPTNLQVDGINYFVTSVNTGAGVTINGARFYKSVQVTGKTNELTVAS